MTAQDEFYLNVDIHDIIQVAENIAVAWDDPILRQQIEAERESIMSAIEKVGTLLATAENAEFQRVMLYRQLLKSAKMATGVLVP